MKYHIIVTDTAQADIRDIVTWWSENRSSQQAEQWYNEITPVIDTLINNPERCPLAPETDLLPTGLRQLHFGVSRTVTHRIVYTIDGSNVIIMHVRHLARKALTKNDFNE